MIFFFCIEPLLATPSEGLYQHRSMNRAAATGKKAMRHPQRLDIRFFGTQIRAEGMIGILGTIMIISVVLAAYFRS
jgi:hypothetical protein